jgi:hypothetical protein
MLCRHEAGLLMYAGVMMSSVKGTRSMGPLIGASLAVEVNKRNKYIATSNYDD